MAVEIAMHGAYLFSVWLHILAATIWIGGMVFLALVVVPVMRRPEYQRLASSFIQVTGIRFRGVGWVCLLLLVVSGIFNLAYRGFDWTEIWNGKIWQGTFGHVLAVKLLVVTVIFLLSGIHDFLIGPRATAIGLAKPGSPEAKRLRLQASWFGRLNLLLALLVIALAVLLVRG